MGEFFERSVLMVGAMAGAFIVAMSFNLTFMLFHGPYHVRVKTDTATTIYTESALLFAENLTDYLRQAHPTATVECLDCTVLGSLIYHPEIRAYQQGQ